MKALYTRGEIDVLSHYLGVRPPAGMAALSDPKPLPRTLTCFVDREDLPPQWQDADDPGELGAMFRQVFRHRVARILISHIQQELPQRGLSEVPGTIEYNRDYYPRRRHGVALLPQFLFMINWSDGGPGFFWPESYYATWLPGFDRYVVTASRYGSEAYGFVDVAIGSFTADEDIVEASGRKITAWWRAMWASWGHDRWEYVWKLGLVDVATAHAWGEEVWPRRLASRLSFDDLVRAWEEEGWPNVFDDDDELVDADTGGDGAVNPLTARKEA